MTAASPFAPPPTRGQTSPTRPRWNLRRRHVLMLALAAEVLVVGARGAERYRPTGIIIEQTLTVGHRIT